MDVLSIDDDPDVRAVLAQILVSEGLVVRTAERLVDGIQLALTRRPDLILLDMNMPDGDGLEACRALKALPGLEGVPILLITGVRERAPLDKARTFGAVDVLHKPFTAESLLAAVKRHARAAH